MRAIMTGRRGIRIVIGLSAAMLLLGGSVLPSDNEEETQDGETAARQAPHDPKVFRSDPSYEDQPYDAEQQVRIYGDKHWNKTARPLLELGRELYTAGPFRQSSTAFGAKNLMAPHLMAFGDWRTGIAYNDNGASGTGLLATRLNLDIDFKLTATERFHTFVRPLDEDGQFTRSEFSGGGEADDIVTDFDPEALFFEGDVGPLLAGMRGEDNRVDLPVALGFMPLLMQNGVWVEDAFTGLALTIPAFNSRRMNISNADLTFFAAFDEISSPALLDSNGSADEHRSNLYGVTAFIEANQGFWELGVAHVDGRRSLADLDYENLGAAFTRRYGGRLSNSLRVIWNFGQDPAGRPRTADGLLLLVENSLVSRKPTTLIPYFNGWVGVNRPQSLARDPGAGGVLKNTGLLFETDGLTGFPKLDDTGHDTWGVALGLEYLFNLHQQIVFEAAFLEVRGDEAGSPALGRQYGVEVRYQLPFANGWILRGDAMSGWRENQEDLFGVRLEIRRKF